MDWKLFLTTFGAVFLAELGDKTQLATMALAADSRSKLTVFVGASLALVVAAGLGVLVGDSIARFVPPQWIQRGRRPLRGDWCVAPLVFVRCARRRRLSLRWA